MNTESLKQKLITELNENSILMYAERQKLKEDQLPKELLQKMLIKHQKQKKLSLIFFGVMLAFLILLQWYIAYSQNKSLFMQNVLLQFTPILGVLYFQMNFQNLGKRIFILELLLNWVDNNDNNVGLDK